jgi:hypothetical protein
MAFSITPPITLMPTDAGSARLTGGLVSPTPLRDARRKCPLGRTLDAADDAGSNVVVISTERGSATFRPIPAFSAAPSPQDAGPEAGISTARR